MNLKEHYQNWLKIKLLEFNAMARNNAFKNSSEAEAIHMRDRHENHQLTNGGSALAKRVRTRRYR